jgi:FkbM family methyltransferase
MVKDLVSEMVVRSPWEPLARAVYGWVSPTARYDSQTLEVMDRIVRPNSNCIDIGCQGYVLREIVRLAPQGKHYAVEPRPERFARLKAKFPQVTLLNVIASDSAESETLDHGGCTPTASGLACSVRQRRETRENPQVIAAPLDDLIPSDLAVRFINLHVQAPELPALRGALKIIRRCHPYIIFEHGRGSADQPRFRPDEVYDFLTLNGLAISQMDEWLIGNSPLARQEFCDQLALRQNSRFMAHP